MARRSGRRRRRSETIRLFIPAKDASLVARNYPEDFRISASAAFVPLPVCPHPLLGRLTDEGFELLLQRGGGDDGVGLAVVGLGDGYARAPDDEIDIGAAERGAGVEGQAGGAGEQGREDRRARGGAEERNGRAAIVAQIGEERGIAALPGGFEKRPCGSRGPGRSPPSYTASRNLSVAAST